MATSHFIGLIDEYKSGISHVTVDGCVKVNRPREILPPDEVRAIPI